MTRTRKVLSAIVIVLAVALLAAGLTLSHDSACGPAPPLPAGAKTMKAVVYRCYGSPDVLKLEDIEKPTPVNDEILIRVHAASVNPLDWHYMRGMPYFMRIDSGVGAPKVPRLGVDFAGTVEAVGPNVKEFKSGDAVFGTKKGAFGEYVNVREVWRQVVPKPANVTFEQAASVPVAAVTALQALRDKGHVQAGQKVLINGASGGVGTYAVQIAKSYGAQVTAVCSARNMEMVRSLGADHVIDYTKEDYTRGDQRYDLIVDMVSNHPLLENRRVMNPQGILVIVGGPKGGPFLGPMTLPIKALMLSPFVSQRFGMMLADVTPDDLNYIAELMQSGRVTAVIDRRYPLSEVPQAVAYVEEGHARGKVIINLEEQ